jgi:hypothetical protein
MMLKNRFSGINGRGTVKTTKGEEWKRRTGKVRYSVNPLFCYNRRTQGGCHKLNDLFLGCRYLSHLSSGEMKLSIVRGKNSCSIGDR